MTPYRIDIASLFKALEPQALPVSDPLRALPAGTAAIVEVAIDPQTGAIGIKFNGAFYSAAQLDKNKLGQLLKVIIQNNNDQILLKILDNPESVVNNQSAQKNHTPRTSVNLSKEEKAVLRDVFYPRQVQVLQLQDKIPLFDESSKKTQTNIPWQKEVATFTSKIASKLVDNIQTIKVANENAPIRGEGKVSFKDQAVSAEVVKTRQKPEITYVKQNDYLRTEQFNKPQDPTVKKVYNTESLAIKPETINKEQLKIVAKIIINQLIPQIITISRTSYKSEQDLFLAVKNLILNKKFEAAEILTSAQKNSVDLLVGNNKKVLVDDSGLSQFVKGNSNVASVKSSVSPGKPASELSMQVTNNPNVQPLQSALVNLASTTNILQKIYTETAVKKEGVLLLLPLYIGGVLKHAESYFRFDQENQNDTPKKRKPVLYKIRLILPVFGDITVDVLACGTDVQLVMSVESEQIKDLMQESLSEITQLFLVNQVRVRSIQINVSSIATEIPSWISSQIGMVEVA